MLGYTPFKGMYAAPQEICGRRVLVLPVEARRCLHSCCAAVMLLADRPRYTNEEELVEHLWNCAHSREGDLVVVFGQNSAYGPYVPQQIQNIVDELVGNEKVPVKGTLSTEQFLASLVNKAVERVIAKESQSLVWQVLMGRHQRVAELLAYGQSPDVAAAMTKAEVSKVECEQADGCDDLVAVAGAVNDGQSAGLLVVHGGSVEASTGDGTSVLSWAAIHNDVDLCELLVGRGADTDRTNGFANTALDYTARYGCEEAMEYLLEEGAAGARAVGFAAGHNHLRCLDMLLEAGFKADEVDILTGRTPLASACHASNPAAVARLLEHGVDVNQRPDDTETTQLAILCVQFDDEHCLEVLTQLIEAGVDVNTTAGKRSTATMSAAFHGNVDALKLLLEHGANPCIDSPSNNAVILAATGGHLECVKLLVDAGADIDHADVCGCTPLLAAVSKKQVETVAWLLEHGADPSRLWVQNETTYTALGIACQMGPHGQLVSMLLDAGADPNEGGGFMDGTPALLLMQQRAVYPTAMRPQQGLHLVQRRVEEDAKLVEAKLLAVELMHKALDKGADVHAQAQSGDTMLMCAASHGHVDIAKRLIDMGASVGVERKDGTSAVSTACRRGDVAMVHLLLERGADVVTPKLLGRCIFTIIAQKRFGNLGDRFNDVEIVNLLCEAGADVNLVTQDQSLMTEASIQFGFVNEERKNDLVQIQKVLLHHGATVQQPINGTCELGAAAWKENVEMIRLLVKLGADPNIASWESNADALSPLMVASTAGCIRSVAELLALGADVNLMGPRGDTALYLAVRNERAEIVRLLLEAGAAMDLGRSVSEHVQMAGRGYGGNLTRTVFRLWRAGLRMYTGELHQGRQPTAADVKKRKRWRLRDPLKGMEETWNDERKRMVWLKQHMYGNLHDESDRWRLVEWSPEVHFALERHEDQLVETALLLNTEERDRMFEAGGMDAYQPEALWVTMPDEVLFRIFDWISLVPYSFLSRAERR